MCEYLELIIRLFYFLNFSLDFFVKVHDPNMDDPQNVSLNPKIKKLKKPNPKIKLVLGNFWDPKWAPKWPRNPSRGHRLILPEKSSSFQGDPEMAQDGPSMAQDRSKIPDGSKMAEDGSKMVQEEPKMGQDGPKTTQGCA